MPKRRILTEDELAKVIQLYERNPNWSYVELEAGVPRQIAKRAYMTYKNSQPSKELSVARETVATDELRKHIHKLTKIAEAFVEIRKMPTFEDKQNSAHVMANFYGTDVLRQYESYARPTEQEVRRISYRNKLLFSSLRNHATNVDWNLFTEWQYAWDLCCKYRAQPRKRAREILKNYQNQKHTQKDINIEKSVNIIIQKLWEDITTSQLGDLICLWDSSQLDGEMNDELNNYLRKIFTDGNHVDVANILCREKDMLALSKAADLIKRAITHFEEELDETILMPVILKDI